MDDEIRYQFGVAKERVLARRDFVQKRWESVSVTLLWDILGKVPVVEIAHKYPYAHNGPLTLETATIEKMAAWSAKVLAKRREG